MDPITLPIAADAGRPETALCISCGLCCRGVLHPTALLDADEVDEAKLRGLRLMVKDDGRDAFRMPCPHLEHESHECTIYEERYRACRRYECDLLKAASAGHVPFAEAMRLVVSAIDLETRIYRHMGGRDASRTIWQQMGAFFAERGGDDPTEVSHMHAELLVSARMLSHLGRRYFESKMHEVWEVRLPSC